MQLAPSQQPHVRVSTIGAFAVLLVVAIAVQAVRYVSLPFRQAGTLALGVATLTSAGVAMAMVVVALATVAVMTRLPDWHEASATEEEPLLPTPGAPRARGRSPLIGFVDLEPRAGASSIAFNLAVLAAVEGRSLAGMDGITRRPRPLCLLSEGQLTEALGLESDPWRVHLDANSGRVVEDLVDLAVRHPSGCELLCVPRGHVARHQLRLLRLALDRQYDLVVVDCSTIDVDLREGAEDTADVLVAVGLASPRSADAAFDMLSETCQPAAWQRPYCWSTRSATGTASSMSCRASTTSPCSHTSTRSPRRTRAGFPGPLWRAALPDASSGNWGRGSYRIS